MHFECQNFHARAIIKIDVSLCVIHKSAMLTSVKLIYNILIIYSVLRHCNINMYYNCEILSLFASFLQKHGYTPNKKQMDLLWYVIRYQGKRVKVYSNTLARKYL